MSVVDYLENVKDIFNDILPVDVLEHFGKQRRKTHYSDYLQANFDIDGKSGDDFDGDEESYRRLTLRKYDSFDSFEHRSS